MKKFLNKILVFLCILLNSSFLLSAEANFNKGGFVKELFEISISKIEKSNLIGKIIDVKYPTEVFPCYIFVFKKEHFIYEVLANSENTNYVRLNEMDLQEYISLGFIKSTNQKTKKTFDFFFTGTEKKFKFLNNLNSYTSIDEIESRIEMDLVKIDKGGFLFPFYTYIFKKDSHFLEIVCSPNENKTKSYFVGGWTYH